MYGADPIPTPGDVQGLSNVTCSDARDGMIWLPGSTFRIGSGKHDPEGAPVHRVFVDGFRIDRALVANRELRRFVNATGYCTLAETTPKATDYPGALAHVLKARHAQQSDPSMSHVGLRCVVRRKAA